MPLPSTLPGGLDIEAEGTGISAPLSRHINLLGALLGRALRERYGEDLFGLVEALRVRCREGHLEEAATL
ncbi:MAG: hypothetical protein R3181_03305, partial [Rubricoccaceae bacterium]|nr:hypothetical protein [Rubricoccaceae bacterium]